MGAFPTLTARDLVEERADLHQWLTDPGEHGGARAWALDASPQEALMERRSARRWATSLHAADLTFVDKSLVRTALAAGDAFDDYSLEVYDVPSLHGLIAFEEPVTAPISGGNHVSGMPVTAASWAVHGGMVEIRWWTDKKSWIEDYCGNKIRPDEKRKLLMMHPPKLAAVGSSALLFGTQDHWPIPRMAAAAAKKADPSVREQVIAEYRLAEQRLVEAEKTLIAAWLLMGQTLTVETRVQAPRASVARVGRIDPALLGTVRQVTLRHKNIAPDQRGQVEGPKREWAHRWCVKGHWRKRRKDARPDTPSRIWVTPHIKGPDGAPILDPSKLVNILRR